MKKKTIRTIQSTLILTYFFMLAIVFLSFVLFFTTSQTQRINNESVQLMTQKTNSISSYIESDTKTLRTLASNIAYSDLIKKHFIAYIEHDTSNTGIPDISGYEDVQNTKILIDLLTSIIGPEISANQIYLYSFQNEIFGVGLDTSISQEAVSNMSWFSQLNRSAHKNLYLWQTDERLAPYFSYPGGSECLSFYMMYYDHYNIPFGIIEVKKTVTDLKDKIELLTNSYGEETYIYDSTGNCVYATTSPKTNYLELVQSLPAENVRNDVIHKKSSNNTNIFYKTCDTNGFTTMIVVDQANLYAPIRSYIKKNTLILAVISFIALLLSYVVSRLITRPITQLYSQIKSFQLQPPSLQKTQTLMPINTGILEFNTLYEALIDMQNNAQISLEKEMLLQNQEMHSRMLALQSQMNPHFLYNSLAVIQSMSEENMNPEIVEMCQAISKILRYISSNKDLLVPLRDEIMHTKNYLTCMVMRYDTDLSYTIDVPDEMFNLRLPKLCIQPIVENSIKYTTKTVRAPWHINITGKITSTHWEISISDNGPGFSEESLNILQTKMKEIDKTNLLPSLEINGMGLLNIYIRFKLFYKGEHIFRITNHINGGAIITIGGTLHD